LEMEIDSKVDLETKAIADCVILFSELSEESRARIIKYLIDRYAILLSPIKPNNTQLPVGVKAIGSPGLNLTEDDLFPKEQISYTNVAARNFAKTEPDWVLLYAYVNSNEKFEFERNVIQKGYEDSNRSESTRIRNISNVLRSLIRKQRIKNLSGTKHVFTEDGLKFVADIMSGKSDSIEIKRTRKSQKNKK